MARKTKNADSSRSKNATGTSSTKAPKKQRWYRLMWDAYQFTRRHEPAIGWMLLGTFVVIEGAILGATYLLHGNMWYFGILGIMFALLGAMFLLTRRFTRAQYIEYDGQPGASVAFLKMIRRGSWSFEEEPVAVDPRSREMVFRGVGRAGVLLLSEGGTGGTSKTLEKEQRKVARVLPNVQVTTVQCGHGEGQVPLSKLTMFVTKLKPTLSKAQTFEVAKRLRALTKPALPIPKGVDPLRVRPDRKGIRGR